MKIVVFPKESIDFYIKPLDSIRKRSIFAIFCLEIMLFLKESIDFYKRSFDSLRKHNILAIHIQSTFQSQTQTQQPVNSFY